MLPIKIVVHYNRKLSIFSLDSCPLYYKKALNKKLSFNFMKKKRLYKSEKKAF